MIVLEELADKALAVPAATATATATATAVGGPGSDPSGPTGTAAAAPAWTPDAQDVTACFDAAIAILCN
jgi:hypothetical protein